MTALFKVFCCTTKGLRRGALWLIILAACLLIQATLLELGLRWFGYGETTRFLLTRETGGKTFYTPNRAFYQQFTALPLDRIMTWEDLDFQVPEDKAPDAYRIFVFGSSAIYGPRTSTRILTMMLRAHAPGIRWEVYNAACPGMNSHVMQAAARACRSLKPDLFIVYMGNNEAVGPYGPTTALGRHSWWWRPPVIRLLIAVNDLRMAQLFRGAMQPMAVPEKDALMAMLPSMTHHERAIEYYEENVRTLCEAGNQVGIPVLLCTLSGNMRYMGVPSPEEPKGPSINQAVRRLAQEMPSVHLADVSSAIREQSEEGLPGYDFFVDNVHFNFAGNYAAAAAMFHNLLPLLPNAAPRDGTPLPLPDCAERLAWTPAAEFEQLGWQLQVFLDDYTRGRVQKRYEALHAQLGDGWRNQLAGEYLHAVSFSEDDLYLRHGAFRWLLNTGRIREAREQAQELLSRHPAARVSLRAVGLAAEAAGEQDAAVSAFSRCLDLYPDDPESLHHLAELLFQRSDMEGAENLYRILLRMQADDAMAQCRLGQILAHKGRMTEAVEMYRETIRHTPRQPLAYRLLDEALAMHKTTDQRIVFWEQIIREYPDAAEPLVRRALLHQEKGEAPKALELLRRAAVLDPYDPLVFQHLGAIALSLAAYDESEQAFQKAVSLNPSDENSRRLLDEVRRYRNPSSEIENSSVP